MRCAGGLVEERPRLDRVDRGARARGDHHGLFPAVPIMGSRHLPRGCCRAGQHRAVDVDVEGVFLGIVDDLLPGVRHPDEARWPRIPTPQRDRQRGPLNTRGNEKGHDPDGGQISIARGRVGCGFSKRSIAARGAGRGDSRECRERRSPRQPNGTLSEGTGTSSRRKPSRSDPTAGAPSIGQVPVDPRGIPTVGRPRAG
jgi:hypothetical protein